MERVARAQRPASTRLTQLTSTQQSAWPVASILQALDAHETGDFAESARLAAQFGRDDRISACRRTRINALVGKNGASFQMVPSEDGDQRRSEWVSNQIKKEWTQTANEAVLAKLLGDVIDLGPGIARIHWDRAATGQRLWSPRLEPWRLEWVRRDHVRNCYVTYTADQGEVEIRPGTGEWLLIEPTGEDSYLGGGVRSTALPWFFRGMTWKDWARYCEKHGVPILAITEPPSNPDPNGKDSKAAFYAQLRRIGREGILRLPKTADGKGGYDAEIIEPSSLSWPAFKEFLIRLDTCIAVLYLGQNLSTEVQGGSLAATLAQNRVRLDYLAADAEALSTALRNQVWMPWGRFNFDWWDDAITSWPKWDTEQVEDLKAKSTVLVNVSTAIAKFKVENVPIDERELLESYGIPLITEQEQAKLEAERKAKETDTEEQKQTPATPATPAPAEKNTTRVRVPRAQLALPGLMRSETAGFQPKNETNDADR